MSIVASETVYQAKFGVGYLIAVGLMFVIGGFVFFKRSR